MKIHMDNVNIAIMELILKKEQLIVSIVQQDKHQIKEKDVMNVFQERIHQQIDLFVWNVQLIHILMNMEQLNVNHVKQDIIV